MRKRELAAGGRFASKEAYALFTVALHANTYVTHYQKETCKLESQHCKWMCVHACVPTRTPLCYCVGGGANNKTACPCHTAHVTTSNGGANK